MVDLGVFFDGQLRTVADGGNGERQHVTSIADSGEAGSCPALSNAWHNVRIGVRPLAVMLQAVALLLPTMSARMMCCVMRPPSLEGAISISVG